MTNDNTPPPAPTPLTLEQIRMAQAKSVGCQGCIYFVPPLGGGPQQLDGYCVRNAPVPKQKPPLVDATRMYCGEFHPTP